MADPILGKRSLQKYIEEQNWNEKKLKNDQKTLLRWSKALDGRWANTKETELTKPFYEQVLIEILGYKEGPDKTYTMAYENATKSSAQKPDVILGNFTDKDHDQPQALIEMESPYTPLDAHNKGVEQAFSYQSQYNRPVRWIIASNFRETRIYDRTREHVEIFYIKKLAQNIEDLKKFIFFLGAKSIVNPNKAKQNSLEKAVENNIADQKQISDKFYADYLKTRKNLIENIINNNPQVNQQQAFTYAQKILDRFIFIAFTQDYGLIPPKTFESVIEVKGATFNRYPIWNQMKELFNAIDKGWPEKHINHFNGGLFKPDPRIDELGITDDVFKYFKIIDDYDFKTDLSVNLLGHIFEQAINDIDAAKKGNMNSSKRKKDGIFYTPASITSYLLNETLQSWLTDAYREIGLDREPSFTEKDYDEYRKYYITTSSKRSKPNKKAKAVSLYVSKLEKLEDKIKSIKIIDPAVGSGSFLTQALENLESLLDQIKNTIDGITLQPSFPTPDTEILSNNLFGVDINKESVEIAKLSLWLRTANKNKPLTTLDNNLKVGNSIIDDSNVVNNAFVWSKEFEKIFKENRGFDIVLGNPPYVTSNKTMSDKEKNYYKNHYSMSQYQENLYRVFTEKGFNLLKTGGWFGFIVPKTWFSNTYFAKMRAFLREKTTHLKVIDIKDQIFEDANVDTSLIIFKKPTGNEEKANSMTIGQWKNNQIIFEQEQKFPKNKEEPIITVKSNKTLNAILNKLGENSIGNIKDFLKITDGIKLFERGKGTPKQPNDKEEFNEFKKVNNFFSPYPLNDEYYPFYEGNKLQRYNLDKNKRYLRYGNHLAAPRKFYNFKGEHIIIRRIPGRKNTIMQSTLVDDGVHLHEQSIWDAHLIRKENLKFLLGLINSSIVSYWLIMKLGVLSRDTFPQLRKTAIESIPVPKISKQRKNTIINEVSIILDAEKRISSLKDKYKSTLGLYSKIKPPRFEILVNNKEKIQNWIVKNILPKKAAEILEYIDTLVKEYHVLSFNVNSSSKKIDEQLYAAFKITDNEIKELNIVFDKAK